MTERKLEPYYLDQILDINIDTGICKWKINKGGCVKKGDEAGNLRQNGYREICIDGKLYKTHRLVYMKAYGREPSDFIDHIDNNRSNNSISNLRVGSNSLNCQNRKSANSNAISSYLGVSKSGNKWMARISLNRKEKYLGSFNTEEEAYEAYVKEKRIIHQFNTL